MSTRVHRCATYRAGLTRCFACDAWLRRDASRAWEDAADCEYCAACWADKFGQF